MTNNSEREQIHNYLKPYKEKVVVYHCVSIYPCPFDQLYLLEIKKLKNIYPYVGFSNHGYGIASEISALTMHAIYFEKHFTDDRAFRHTDAAASLEPIGLQKLCRDLKNVNIALQERPDNISQEELEQTKKLRYYQK
jgi:N-acetylneuraminate synthase